MVTLNAIKSQTRKISAESFAKMSKKERSELTVVKIVPPSFKNNNDFGKIEVKINHPSYVVKF